MDPVVVVGNDKIKKNDEMEKKKIPDGITNFKGIVGHIENIFGHCHLTF